MRVTTYETKGGRIQFRPIFDNSADFSSASDEMLGFCLACGNEQSSCEPDARGYTCERCSCKKVYGAEELLLMGIALVGGIDD